jgi:YVTN family beta-propeller protein
VSVINTATNSVISTIPVGSSPESVAVRPDGTQLYVTSQGGTVSVIDTAINTATSTVYVGNDPVGVAVSSDGAYAYVTNESSSTVSVIALGN